MRCASSTIALVALGVATGCAPGGSDSEVVDGVSFRPLLFPADTVVNLPVGVHVARDQETLDSWFTNGGLAETIDFSREIVVFRRAEICDQCSLNWPSFYYRVSARRDAVVVELPWAEEPACAACWSLPAPRAAMLALPIEYADYRFEAR